MVEFTAAQKFKVITFVVIQNPKQPQPLKILGLTVAMLHMYYV